MTIMVAGRRAARTALAGIIAAAAAGCGGGDGETGPVDLEVSIGYEQPATLLRASTVPPVLTGFRGHAPRCTFLLGELPQGMALQPSCTITGTPTEAGHFYFDARVGAEGVSNEMDVSLHFYVRGPSTDYQPGQLELLAGDTVDFQPEGPAWVLAAGETLTYEIVDGSLPPGVSLDPATGRVHGVIQEAPGYYNASVRAVLTSGDRSAVVAPGPVSSGMSVDPTHFWYPAFSSPITAWLGQPFTHAPGYVTHTGTFADFRLAAWDLNGAELPPGLALDPATGVIAGRPTVVTDAPIRVGVEATFSAPGVAQFATHGNAIIRVDQPLYAYYRPAYNQWPDPIVTPISPTIHVNTPIPFVDPVYSFSVPSGCALPAGLTLDPASGVIGGTTQLTSFPGAWDYCDCYVLITVTSDGVDIPNKACVW